MKKMLVKAVALSLVLGGVGFVANNAQAFSPIEEIQLKSKVDANHERSMNNQTAIQNIKADVATNKANIQTNANTKLLFRKKQQHVEATLQWLTTKLTWKNKSAKTLTKN